MRLNRHARMRQHKRELKKKHAANSWCQFDTRIDEERAHRNYEEDKDSKWVDKRNEGYDYWNHCYLSGRRRFAKDCTNRKIRNIYRNLIASGEFLDDVIAPKGSDYEKFFDYLWTIW